MADWSPRARNALRRARVAPRGAAAQASPTVALDEELFTLTGGRGLPILQGLTLGYPSTLDTLAEEGASFSPAYCLWGKGEQRIHLKQRSSGAWETSDLGTTMGWRAVVELLALREEYQSWLPVVTCQDAREELPRRWGRDLASALGMTPAAEVSDTFMDADLLCCGSSFFARSMTGLDRLLAACREHGFAASVSAPGVRTTHVDDLEKYIAEEPWTTLLESSTRDVASSLESRGQDAVRQVSRFRDHAIEVVQFTRTGAERLRPETPALGSERLREYLRRYALALPAAPPSVFASQAMLGALAEVRQVGRLLLDRPDAGDLWLGLWRFEDLPSTPAKAVPKRVEIAPGEPPLCQVQWPVFRWGDLDLVCIAGGPEFECYLCDATGAVWLCDAPYDQFDFLCGSVVCWLERAAFNTELNAMKRSGPVLTMPLAAPGELPAHFNIPRIPECSDSRSALYVSTTYTVWESSPTRGRPVIAIQGRDASELVLVVRWAKQRWGTARMSIPGTEEAPQALADAMSAEGIQLVDGGTGGWLPSTVWEADAG